MSITERLLSESPDGITVEQLKGLATLERNQYNAEVLMNARYDTGECVNVENISKYHCYEWKKSLNPNWNFVDAFYRIKQSPKMVHFGYEDFIEEIKKNGGYVTNADGIILFHINRLYLDAILIGNDELNYTFYGFCQTFTRLDGSKFEKEVK